MGVRLHGSTPGSRWGEGPSGSEQGGLRVRTPGFCPQLWAVCSMGRQVPLPKGAWMGVIQPLGCLSSAVLDPHTCPGALLPSHLTGVTASPRDLCTSHPRLHLRGGCISVAGAGYEGSIFLQDCSPWFAMHAGDSPPTHTYWSVPCDPCLFLARGVPWRPAALTRFLPEALGRIVAFQGHEGFS